MHLKIIDFINQNKDWRDILSEAPYYLSIKDDGEYTILKYNQISSDFSNDYVKESRGLIIRKDGDNYIPVCVPFLKFFNFGEKYAADIDWSSAKTYEKLDGCFTGIDKVLLADGTNKNIKEIVNAKLPLEVLSYNFTTGQIEAKRICGWKKSEKPATYDNWLTFHLKCVKTSLVAKNFSQHCVITPTKNHMIFTKDDKGNILEKRADAFKENDIVLTPVEDLTYIEKQTCFGTLLGDGSCRYYGEKYKYNEAEIDFQHSLKQKEYVDFKGFLLKNIGGKFTESFIKNSYGKYKYRFRSNAHPGISLIRDICYKNNHKCVSLEWLKQLDWLGFAIWYMDDGTLNRSAKNKAITLCTHGFSKQENEIIQSYYKKLGYTAYINYDKRCKKHFIVFSTKSSDRIWQNIRKYIPDCMQYKLPEKHRGYFEPIVDTEQRKLVLRESFVTKIEKGLTKHRRKEGDKDYGTEYRYDIEVEDNHNYFCQGCLVHNSLMKFWYDKDEWHISTNGTIDAYKAEVQAGFTKQSYGELIKKVLDRDYKDFQFDKNKIYLFEFTSPENRVIIRYTEDRLWLLSIRDKNTWDEEEITFDWKWRPKEYKLNNISDCIKNAEELGDSGEGYVVVDRYWNRIKVKSPVYVSLSHLVGAGFSAKRILEIIFEGEVDEVLSYFPEYKVHFDEAQKAYENYIGMLEQSIQSAKVADSEFVEKKDKAKYIISQAEQFHQCSDIGFKWLGNKDLTVEDYVQNIKERYGIGKLIDNILELKQC